MQTNGLLVLSTLLAFLLMMASFAFVMAPTLAPEACRAVHEFFRTIFKKPVLLTAIVLAAMYGGSKHTGVQNKGADEGIVLSALTTDYDSTNDVTEVIVSFSSGTVTAETPVSVRPYSDVSWTELVKSNAVVNLELSPHTLTFLVQGNVGTNAYWWVGSDTPAVIIESKGIEILYFAASSRSVQIMWSCDDPLATEFMVQRRRKDTDPWETVGVTTSTSYVYTGFTVGETWTWRVISTYEVGA